MRSSLHLLKAIVIGIALMHSSTAKATHILGGNIGYTYLGETSPGSQIYRYRITMQFYLNCGTDSNYPTLGSLLNLNGGIAPVGVYTEDPSAPNTPRQRITTASLTLSDSMLITPELPDGCALGTGLCTKLGVLTGLVELPLNFGGYHLYFQMNSRNHTILNLNDPDNTGIGFYAFIPPPLVHNSSPIWLGSSTPMLCISDTSTFINSATDPDGDQLIFSFVTPYNSVGAGGGIIQPPLALPTTIPPVNYLPGFGVAQPFGTGSYAFINGATGLTRYLPPQQGNYAVAVEVKEYRNGTLIGRTRRDLQLQAMVCPPNDAPVAAAAQPLSYTVQAGDNVCFPLSFQDPNGDSLHLTASGTIFDGTLYDPPATITAPINGVGSVAATFCWNTDCAQVQSQPYLFSVSVSDNGCPPRTVDAVYQVNVLGFTGPTAINGPSQVCPGQAAVSYSTAAIDNITYAWTVSGGTILSGQGSNSITVQWGTSGPGAISVNATNAQGCPSPLISLPVTVVPQPVASAGADLAVCPGTTVTLGGTPTGAPGSSFAWLPATGLSNASAANPTTIPAASTDYIVQVTTSGCTTSDTMRVTVSQPHVNAGTDVGICTGTSAQLNATGPGSIHWSPGTGLSSTTIADPTATPTTTTTYTATLTDSVGCVAMDSITVTVNPLPTVDAGADQTPCENTTTVLGGAPTGPAGSTFSWTPAIGLDNTAIANPTLSVTSSNTYTVTVTSSAQCTATDAVTITVLPQPTVDAGPDFTVCSGDSVQLQGSGSGTLLWTPAFGLSDPSVPDPVCLPEATITYTLTATGVNTCTNSDQTTVTVSVLPNADAGADRTICAGDSVSIGTAGPGTFVWSPASGLNSASSATPMASPATTTTYLVTLTDTLTCAGQDSVTVTVIPHGSAGDDGVLSICASGSATSLFSSLGSAPSAGGQWLDPDLATHGPTVDPTTDPDGSYTYVVDAGSQCADSAVVLVDFTSPAVAIAGTGHFCLGDSTQLTATGGVQYAWSPPLGISDANIPAPFFNASATTVYSVLVTDTAGCSATSQITVSVLPLPQVDAGADALVCAGAGTPIGGSPTSASGTSFTWQPASGLDDAGSANPTAAPATSTVYTVVVHDADGCSAMDSVTVNVAPTPTLDAGPDTAFCAGGSVQLGASGTGNFNWLPATGLSDPGASDPVASPQSTTVYTVTLTDANNCTADALVTVTVDPLPTVDAGTDTWLCLGSTVALSGSGDAGSYSWQPTGPLNDPSSPTPLATPASSTTFVLVITDANGCSASDPVLVTVGTDPPIDAGPDRQTCAGTAVILGASPTSVPGSSYQWSPATGLDDPGSANPSAAPSATTTYTLMVSNDTCTSTASVIIGISSRGQAGFRWRLEPGCDALRAFLTDSSSAAVAWHWDLGQGNTANTANAQTFIPYGRNTLITLAITDAAGCSDSTSHLFSPATYNDEVQLNIPNVFSPNGDGENDFFTLGTNAFLGPCASMEVMNRWGQTVYLSHGNDLAWDGRTVAGIPAVPGTYFYVVRMKDIQFKGNLTLIR